MDIVKIAWGLRALCWKMLGRSVGLPTYIGAPLYVGGASRIVIGKRVRIWPGLRIESINGARIFIEDDVVIGQNCHITAGEDLYIRRGTVLIGNNVVTNIIHPTIPTLECPIDRPILINPLILGERLLVGYGAVILAGNSICSGSTIGANAVVSRIVTTGASVIAGVPARVCRAL